MSMLEVGVWRWCLGLFVLWDSWYEGLCLVLLEVDVVRWVRLLVLSASEVHLACLED